MTVEHEEREHRFVVRVNGEEAELVYEEAGPQLLDLQHTYVPRVARGQGVAEALAKTAMDYARERGYRVIPSCPFVRTWLESHPEEMDIVEPR